jgi:hypothetical protein
LTNIRSTPEADIHCIAANFRLEPIADIPANSIS